MIGFAIPAWMTRSDEPAAPESRLGSAVGMPRCDEEEDDGRRRKVGMVTPKGGGDGTNGAAN